MHGSPFFTLIITPEKAACYRKDANSPLGLWEEGFLFSLKTNRHCPIHRACQAWTSAPKEDEPVALRQYRWIIQTRMILYSIAVRVPKCTILPRRLIYSEDFWQRYQIFQKQVQLLFTCKKVCFSHCAAWTLQKVYAQVWIQTAVLSSVMQTLVQHYLDKWTVCEDWKNACNMLIVETKVFLSFVKSWISKFFGWILCLSFHLDNGLIWKHRSVSMMLSLRASPNTGSETCEIIRMLFALSTHFPPKQWIKLELVMRKERW